MKYHNIKSAISKVARKNWSTVLQASTGLSPKCFKNIHQPCPLCRKGKDRYRFDDNKGFGTYYCSKCGPGDGFMFVAKYHKYSEEQVIAHLDDLLGVSSGAPKVDLKSYVNTSFSDTPPVRVIMPAPIHAAAPNFHHFKLGSPSKTWGFTDIHGNICFYSVRFELPCGGKDVLPMSYCHYWDKRSSSMKYGWRWKGVTKDSGFKRPLYGLSSLKDEGWVVVVEGEKTADAAQALFPDYSVVTWSGGTKSIPMTDWSPLMKKNILIWPDNDEAGYSACVHLYHMFLESNNTRAIRMVELVGVKPEGWDLADTDNNEAVRDALKVFVSGNSFSELVCKVPAT